MFCVPPLDILLVAFQLRNSKKELKLSRIVTVCHGDFWSNNILMTKDEDQVAFIDYQMLSLLHPALDIWYLLTVNTDKVRSI